MVGLGDGGELTQIVLIVFLLVQRELLKELFGCKKKEKIENDYFKDLSEGK